MRDPLLFRTLALIPFCATLGTASAQCGAIASGPPLPLTAHAALAQRPDPSGAPRVALEVVANKHPHMHGRSAPPTEGTAVTKKKKQKQDPGSDRPVVRKNARAGQTVRKRARKVVEDARQAVQPKAFRIGEEAAVPPSSAGRDDFDDPRLLGLLKAVTELATGVWRMQKRLMSERVADDAARVSGALRLAETALDDARTAGLDVRDFVGQRQWSGLPINVLAYERSERCAVETIIEAVRPALFFGDRPIQRADVVVGTPDLQSSAPPHTAPPDDAAPSDDAPAAPATNPPESQPETEA